MTNKRSVPFLTPGWARALAVTFRLVTGTVFAISGFTKGVDPWGTLFILQDYAGALGWQIPDILLTTAAFLLPAAEFALGIFNILGCFRRTTAWLTAATMAFMLPLTAWIAVADPVPDCGCFGEAFTISNAATFWKNVALTICAVWGVCNPLKMPTLVIPALQWIAAAATTIFILTVSITGYYIQPLRDYRPYPAGATLLHENGTQEEDEEEYLFIYAKNGVEKTFTIDNIPAEEEGWQFVDRKQLRPAETKGAALTLWDASASEELTGDEAHAGGRTLYLMVASPDETGLPVSWQINTIAENAARAGIRFVGVMAADSAGIAEWRDLTMADYPIYRAEDTSIKEVVRGNPALVYTHANRIVWKTALESVDAEKLFTPDEQGVIYPSGANGRQETSGTLFNLSALFICILAVLVSIGHLTRIKAAFTPGKKSPRSITHDDTAHHAG